jgi:hypothetical protein
MEENELRVDRWGFDLTSISVDDWKELMLKLNINDAVLQSVESVIHGAGPFQFWSWKDQYIQIRTGNNPITGQFASQFHRPNETGYASYIGIEGKPELVNLAVEFIRERGLIKGSDFDIGESPHKCEFI